MSKIVQNRIFRPAIFYFLVVLISGVWLRIQWTWPELTILNAKFLIHAHSHLALLGWIFPVVSGFFVLSFVPNSDQKSLTSLRYWIPIHFCIIAMTVAFSLQGYAFWSISLSTLYILITSIWSIHFLLKMDDQNTSKTLLVKLAVFSFLGSNMGPLALSGGTLYGESWITFWITYYLHSQFSLWIPLGVLAIMFSVYDGSLKSGVSEKSIRFTNISKIMIWGYFIGSILQLETMSRALNIFRLTPLIGVLGSILVIITSFYLVYILSIRNRVSYLILTGLLLFAIKSILQFIASIPDIGQLFIEIHFLKIGYTHLLLLGSYTFILIGFLEILKFKINSNESDSHIWDNQNHSLVSKLATTKLNSTGLLIFMVGSLSMILLLMTIGISQYLGIYLDFNIQFYLFLTGFISLAGFITSLR
ncbi:MAG TPA: hypothetical protein DCE78_04515 [Bacteroidetes bacterium]|nr:hypothetical protein [Bacteroidota bacterium]